MPYWIKKIYWWFHRANHGWADNDAWGMCDYIAQVNIEMLKHLKKNLHGAPPDLFDSENKENPLHEWESIIDQMISGFQAILAISTMECWDIHATQAERDQSYEDHMSVYQNGMRLYEQYLLNLWD